MEHEEMVLMKLSNQLNELVHKKKITIEEIATKTNSTKTFIESVLDFKDNKQKYKDNKNHYVIKVSIDFIWKLGNNFDIKIEELLI